MMTDTAVHAAPLDRICWEICVNDYSVRAANWCYGEIAGRHARLLSLPDPHDHGSGGSGFKVAAWPTTPAEWRSASQRQMVPKDTFVPKTELGRKLWALRQKYIAEGGRLYTMKEIQQEVARRRGESE